MNAGRGHKEPAVGNAVTIVSRGTSYLLEAVKVMAAAHPEIAFVASILQLHVPKAREQNVDVFLDELATRVSSLEAARSSDPADDWEFRELFQVCMRNMMATNHETKVRVFARILANQLLPEESSERASYTEAEHLARAMDALSVGCLRVLVLLYDVVRGDPGGETTFDRVMEEFRGEWDASLTFGLVRELENAGLVQTRVPSIATREYGNYSIVLTPLGERFVRRFGPLGPRGTNDAQQ